MRNGRSLKMGALCLGMTLLSVACKKNGTSGGSSSGSTYLSSIHVYSSGTQTIDSLEYDDNHRLIRLGQYIYDSTGGAPVFDSLITDFTYSGSSALPDAYSSSMPSSGIINDLHQLTFDSKGRISKDTSISGSRYVAFFTYPGGNQATTTLFDGTPQNNQIDTAFITNGNVASISFYFPYYGGPDQLAGIVQFEYSSIANPAYQSNTANALGPLLFNLIFDGFGGYQDFTSRNIVTKLDKTASGGQIYNFLFNKDTQGKVTLAYIDGIPLPFYNLAFYYYHP